MIIKKMKLQNFRQYIDDEIKFAVDGDKNVTVIMGDNGTGKTTLAQAFQWALYGKTNFQILVLSERKWEQERKKRCLYYSILCIIILSIP